MFGIYICVKFLFTTNSQLQTQNEERVKCPTYVIQSQPVDDSGGDTTVQETVQFTDIDAGGTHGMSNPMTEGMTDATQVAGLGSFLSRPVRICNYTWNESDGVGPFSTASFKPWYLFFNNSAIKYKLNNFAWIKCNLHLKVIVNASPFYYGALLMSYRPILDVNDDTITTTSTFAEWVPKSQRPHLWVWPQESRGGSLKLPFLYHKNWLNIQSSTDLQNMGQVNTDIIYALNSANGATGVGVSIQVYAWATDVELSGPSLGLAVQSQPQPDDEYGEGCISKPASALANFAGKFAGMGGAIGTAATVTQIGAGAVAGIAKLFGYTNVPVISNVHAFKPTPVPPLASTEIGYATEKLTLDAKNELSPDPSILGLPSVDELEITHLASKESILTTTYWDAADAVDSQLFISPVTPWLIRNDRTGSAGPPDTRQDVVNLPPCAWVANLFASWRGDVIFRFTFVKSKYHRGRVVLYFDPSGQGANNISTVTEGASSIYTQIVDLGVEDAVELRVPYSQALTFLDTSTTVGSVPWAVRGADGSNFVYDGAKYNGTVCMRVLNVLTGPTATARVGVIVSIRGADNLEFANPSFAGTFSPFTIQSQPVFDDAIVPTIAGKPHPEDKDRYLRHFGERVFSLRQLLRRFVMNEIWWEPNDNTSSLAIIQHNMTRFPLPYGFDPAGVNFATGPIAGTSKPFNWTVSTPYNWIAPAFVGQRGSMQWLVNTNQNSANAAMIGHVSISRRPNVGVTATRTRYSRTTKNGNANQSQISDVLSNLVATSGGTALTNVQTNAGLCVQLPNYSKFNFQSTSPAKITNPSTVDGSNQDTSRLEYLMSPLYGATTRGLFIEKYAAIGTDFNVFFFLNVPTFFFYVTAPTQVYA